MGRSVSCPTNAIHKVYFTFLEEDYYFFDSLIESIQENFKSYFNSLENSDKWIEREDHVVLENNLCKLGISEYMGLCCLWVVMKEDFPNLSESWIYKNLIPRMDKDWSEYKKIATASNGESFYTKVVK